MNILTDIEKPFEYTEEQAKGLEFIQKHIQEFKLDELNKEIMLAGYAGTGKTSIAITVINFIKKFRNQLPLKDIVVLAPTNKAVQVLESKIGNVVEISTLHRILYGAPYFDDDGNYIWKTATNISKSVILVDEASMLNSKLVNDLRAVSTNCLIIYMGDNFQLEPIGDNPHLFDLPNKVQLTEVKRVDNDILKLATYIRSNDRNIFPFNVSDDITVYNGNEKGIFLKSFVTEYRNNNDSVILVATNALRNTLNEKARMMIYQNMNPEILEIGEKLISIANSPSYSNGDMLFVKSFEFLKKVDLTLVKGSFTDEISVYLYNIFDGQKSRPLLFIPSYNKPSLYHQEINSAIGFELIEEIGNPFVLPKMTKHGPDWNDMIFNKDVIIATYSYSISTHKSQGSEFNNVFVNQNYCAKSWNCVKWFYTAITRSNSKLHILPNYKLQRQERI